MTYNQLLISCFKFSGILGLHFSFVVPLFVCASGLGCVILGGGVSDQKGEDIFIPFYFNSAG